MEDLRERVEAVERALTDGEGDLTALAEGAAAADRVDSLATDLEALQDDVAELQAATQALRGYVGNVRSVNEGVEERADGAVAAVEKLEERVDTLEDGASGGPRGADGRSLGRSGAARRSTPAPTGSAPDGRGNQSPIPSEGPDVCRSCGRPERDRRSASGEADADREDGNRSRGGPRTADATRRRKSPRNGDRIGRRDRQAGPGRGTDDQRDSLLGEHDPASGRTSEDRRTHGTHPGFLQRVRERL